MFKENKLSTKRDKVSYRVASMVKIKCIFHLKEHVHNQNIENIFQRIDNTIEHSLKYVLQSLNSYLLHFIIDSFPWILKGKIKIKRLKPVLLAKLIIIL